VFLTILVGLTGCFTSTRRSQWREGTTTIEIAGPPGAPFKASYVRGDQRYEISDTVPFTIVTGRGLSEFEVRKLNLDDSFTVEARFDTDELHMNFSTTAGPKVPGVRVDVRNGLSVVNLKE
jgi:hypothetical protein